GLGEAADLLRGWDLRADEGSRAAALFYVWVEELRDEAARSLYGAGGWFPDYAVTATLERGTLPWAGGRGDVAYDSVARAAMLRADSIVAGRAWGALNHVLVEHALGTVGLVDRALDLDLGPFERAGSGYTVNVSNYGGDRPPYLTTHGPSQRHVVDMSNIDGAGGFILAGGQSGNPLSDHYADQFPAWRTGGLWRVPLERDAAAARIGSWTVLRPGDERPDE
ncbi:MAG: penicillin acylase family protein, partial [Longimicrobiales bacterium]